MPKITKVYTNEFYQYLFVPIAICFVLSTIIWIIILSRKNFDSGGGDGGGGGGDGDGSGDSDGENFLTRIQNRGKELYESGVNKSKDLYKKGSEKTRQYFGS